MKNLTKVIGPAPSEMPRDELIKLIRREHQRISEGVEAYTTKAKRKTSSSGSRSLSATKFLAKLKEAGMTLEQYEELTRKMEEAESGDAT